MGRPATPWQLWRLNKQGQLRLISVWEQKNGTVSYDEAFTVIHALFGDEPARLSDSPDGSLDGSTSAVLEHD